MTKVALPIILASVVMIAGIFAFMPIEQASTVHTTIQSTIQNTQFNNVNSTFTSNLATNATASCSTGSFLVYYTFSNSTVSATASLGIDVRDDDPVGIDLTVEINGNETASGVVAGTTGEKMNFTGLDVGGDVSKEDSGQLSLTIQCQSTATPSLIP